MALENVPYLSGGIFFNLLIESTKQKTKARAKASGEKDMFSDSNLMSALVTLNTGDTFTPSGDTFKKNTSDYKRCRISRSTYLDFGNIVKLTTFHDEVMSKTPAIYGQMKKLVDRFLSESRYLWLTKALIETIMQDATIPDNTEFYTDLENAIKKKQLNEVAQINVDCFLLNIWDYILQNKKDNTLGRATFENWYSQYTTNGIWRFCNDNIGSSISQHITLLRFLSSDNAYVANRRARISTNENRPSKSLEDNVICTCISEMTDDKAKEIRSEKKQDINRIKQVVHNPKIVNQYAEKIYNIEHVEHLS